MTSRQEVIKAAVRQDSLRKFVVTENNRSGAYHLFYGIEQKDGILSLAWVHLI